ncbi:hypothetical protein LXL04_037677 [Taraxacum kok-saghyz]
MVDANASNPDLPRHFSISLKCEALKTDRLNTEELEPEPVRLVPVPEPPFRPVLVPIPGTRFFCPSLSESNDHYPYDELQLKLMRMNFAFHNDQLPQNLMTFFRGLFTDDSKVTQEDIDKFVEKVEERKRENKKLLKMMMMRRRRRRRRRNLLRRKLLTMKMMKMMLRRKMLRMMMKTKMMIEGVYWRVVFDILTHEVKDTLELDKSVSEPDSSRTKPPTTTNMSQSQSIVLPFIAPPSSPASFLHSNADATVVPTSEKHFFASLDLPPVLLHHPLMRIRTTESPIPPPMFGPTGSKWHPNTRPSLELQYQAVSSMAVLTSFSDLISFDS